MIEIEKLLSTDNTIFSGGFGLALLAIGAQGIRLGSNILLNLARKHLIISLEITNKDKSYPWILQWITLQGTKTQHLSVETLLKSTNNHNTNTIFNLVPGPGNHFIFYRNHILGIQRIREQQMLDLNTGKPWEKIQIYGFGRNTKIFDELLQEALEIATRKEDGKTVVYTNWGTEWRPFGQPRPRRSLESVILDEGIGEKIYFDVLEWKNSFQWYSDRGIPYRRGYLLYGPPGSGKTSFIMALAGCLGYNICVLNLSERGLTDDRLAVALSSVPPMCIVLLEDVDVAFPHPNRSNDRLNENKHHGLTGSIASYGGGSSEVTFSGLLNILDGAVSSEERLIFMTTNYVDRLDSALIRPGRIDFAQLISDATPYQIRKLFTTFYRNVSEELTNEFVTVASSINKLSMAQLQGYFLLHKDNPQAVLEYIKKIALSCPSLPNNPPSSTTPISNNNNDHDNVEKNNMNNSQVNVQNIRRNQGVRRITAYELDKMPFNPQYDWEKDIRQ